MSGDRYFIADQNEVHFVTFTVVDWVDVFTRPVYKEIIPDNLNFCVANKGLLVFGWCLMTNHLHAIVQAREGFGLSNIIRDYKKFTSKAIVKAIDNETESRREWMLHRFDWAGLHDSRITNYKFWQESNHAIALHPTQPHILQQKLDYIHQNPVRAGIVSQPHEYLYSSAGDYAGIKGPVDVVLIDG